MNIINKQQMNQVIRTLTTVEVKIVKKLTYYEEQLKSALHSFLADNTRKSRDRVLKLTAKIESYKEVLETIEKETTCK